ncbi:MAG: ABC transporter permease [Promethearchaeota archaeon]|nr:MAG: ABC transporter permease [Candidatus Lokiarchaeota archaeon]
MSLENLLYKIRSNIKLSYIKHAWLNIKKDRAKAIFGILGIMTSIILLTAIGMVNDTLSYNYMEIVTSTTGNADILISKRIQTDLNYNPFFNESIIETNLNDIEGVEELFPRMMMLVRGESPNISSNYTLQLYGIDFIKEATNGHIGDLNIVNSEGKETGEIYSEEPNIGECVLLWNTAQLLNVTIGDFIQVDYLGDSFELEIVEVCRQELKFTELENTIILVNLEQAQSILTRGRNEINFIAGTVENPESIYDVRDVDLTLRKLRIIGTRIQTKLDPNEFTVSMPKLEELSAQQFLLIAMTIIFWFITIISVLITGILINSILSTSSEERIREYGVLRVLGGKKTFPVKIVIFEGFFMGLTGSIIGVIMGLIFTPPIVNALFILTGSPFQNFDYVIQPQTIILAFSIGSITSLVISLLPALKTSKLDIIKSITPFHSKEEGWEVKKEGSVNVRNFLIGLSIATIGMVVFILLPNIIVTGNFMSIAGLFIGLLGAILIGLVFSSVGIVPIIQNGLLFVISPFIRKYYNIIKISLKRNRRRNTSTMVMFALSFSFIFFITSVTEMETENTALNLRFQYGSDLVIINQGLDANVDAITLEMANDLSSLTGINDVAVSLYNMFDITSVLSIAYSFGEGGSFDEESINEAFLNIFEFYAQQRQSKYQVIASDIARHDELEIGFVGIEDNYYNIIDRELFIWSSPSSGFNYSFSELFNHNDTCIIATSLATRLGIEEIGEKILLTFYDPEKENDAGTPILLEVVGISGGMPGFYNFRSSEASAQGGGIMVSLDNYMNLMNVSNAGEENMIIDKIFVNLLDASTENIEETKEEITTLYSDKDYLLDDAISKINFMNDMFQRQSTMLEIINWFAIAIAIFGLVSTMYAIIVERKFEIGILRSLGMKTRNVRNLFLIESILLLLSSGTAGTIIGTFSAYLMETNIGLFTELPIVFSIPVDALLRVFIISIAIGFIGMYLILIKLSKQTIMDIFRQTF